MSRPLLLVALVVTLLVATGTAASATLHPVVESFDCVLINAPHVFDNVPTEDIGSPPGQTIPQGPDGRNDHAALSATSDGFTDFSSPAWFGHKLDGQCGKKSL